MTIQHLIDLGSDNPIALSPERMSDTCARLVIQELYLGDYEVTDWQRDFIMDCSTDNHFSAKQKKVIYNLGRKFRII